MMAFGRNIPDLESKLFNIPELPNLCNVIYPLNLDKKCVKCGRDCCRIIELENACHKALNAVNPLEWRNILEEVL